MTFNLLEEPWIPVSRADGRPDRMGIREALSQAEDIREVRDSSPLVTFGIHRLLISVLKWLEQSTEVSRWAQLAHGTSIPSDVLALLDEPKRVELFDLANPKRPLFQSREELAALPALATAADKQQLPDAERRRRKLKTAAYLATEIPTETYKAHFWHGCDETTKLCTACCVCGLVTLPPFCTGVGQGNETSINNVPPVYWLVHGPRLLDTLLLNMPHGRTEGDAPCWADGKARDRIGPLEGMTWQARRVAIRADSSSDGRCDRCGEPASDRNPLVRWIIFGNRGVKRANDQRLASWVDPHIAGDFERKKEQMRFVGLAASDSPGSWCERVRALLTPSLENRNRQAPNVAALASGSCKASPREAVAYMLFSNKADFEHWREERWPISSAMASEPSLRDAILAAAKHSERFIESCREKWPENVWRLRRPDRKPDKNARKSWRKGAPAAAARSTIAELDKRLAAWFRTQMRAIANGAGPEVFVDLSTICRQVGRGVFAPVAGSLSPASSPLGEARIDHVAEELVEDAVRRVERAIARPKRNKT